MQTFLPYPSFENSAAVLDNRRLNKQITETRQILSTLLGHSASWQNHPAVKMWRGYEKMLAQYGLACYAEWQARYKSGARGGKLKHNAGEWIVKTDDEELIYGMEFEYRPWWLNDAFCSAHRAILLAKDFEWYSRFGWLEEPAVKVNGKWPYIWPV